MPHLATLGHNHSGKLRPHKHTTYLPLALVLLVVGFIMLNFTATAADLTWTRPGPAAGSVGLSGVVAGKPPAQGAVITSPSSGQRFSTTPVTIKGTCPTNTLVELYKNDIFAGSTPCSTTGSFSLEIDLLIGQNTLIARVYDALNQQGPDSNSVVVFYDALGAQAGPLQGLNFGGEQLLINTDAVFRGAFPGREMTIPIDILGGRAPYAVNVQWGDATNKIIARNDNSSFRTSHTYQKAGTYQLSLQATDADGRVAFLTVAAIVNGQPPAEVAATTDKNITSSLLILWPLYAITFATVVSFWVGEWREKNKLEKHGKLLPHYR
jgi:hypothetical protein